MAIVAKERLKEEFETITLQMQTDIYSLGQRRGNHIEKGCSFKNLASGLLSVMQ